MRPVLRTLLAAATTVAAFATLQIPASAGTGLCREAYYGPTWVIVCFDLREDGTTVAPRVTVDCEICNTVPVGVDKTGFVANAAYPAPAIDPATGSVRVYAGDLGWLYVDGKDTAVHTDGFCVGEPAFCA